MEHENIGTWFGVGTVGSVVAFVLAAMMTTNMSPGDETPALVIVLVWVGLACSVIALVSIAGLINVVLERLTEIRDAANRRK